jgi:hypothetical protein
MSAFDKTRHQRAKGTVRDIQGAGIGMSHWGKMVVGGLLAVACVLSPAAAFARAPVHPAGAAAGAFKELTGVSADSASDAWAIGDLGNASPVVEHWDGTSWASVAVQTPGTDVNLLHDVLALSPSDVWVVGEYGAGDGTHDSTLIEHWDGTSFTVVPSPNPSAQFNALLGISAASPGDVWASGTRGAGNCLVEHWNGAKWTMALSPGGRSCDVSADPAHDVWAVAGDHRLLHWDGQQWQVAARFHHRFLSHVTAVSSTKAWVLGDYPSPSGFAAEWGGTRWSKELASCDYTGWGGLAPLSAADVWVVGGCPDNGSAIATSHWNGSSWVQVPVTRHGFLRAVDGVSTNDVWAVGYTQLGGKLIEHWDGSTWSVYPAGG